jgi:hypothetical protein
MRAFDRVHTLGQPESGWREPGPFEAERFFAQVGEWSQTPLGEAFGEAERLEFASELLEAASGPELDAVLRDLIGRAGQAAGKVISPAEGNAIGGVLKGAAQRVLSGIGTDMPHGAGRAFGLELEGLSNEDREFEIGRSYVDFAGEAIRNLTSQPRFLHPEEAADAAVVEAARTHAPGLLSRGAAGPNAFRMPSLAPLAEDEFDLNLGDARGLHHDIHRAARANPKLPYLRSMNLDKFIWNRAVLTPELREKIESLAREVKLSWTTLRPIGRIILVGHTDNTGPEAYNRDLGDWRAGEVQKALIGLLKDDLLNRNLAIVVEQSPGSSSPVADNGSDNGRALNRRVEAFVTPPMPPTPPSPPPPNLRLRPHDMGDQSPPWWVDIPKGRPGKSLDDALDDTLGHFGVPKSARSKILSALYDKDWGALSQALKLVNISGTKKDALIDAMHGVFETKAH